MPQVRVAGVALDQTGQHVLLIKPVDELPGAGSVLPIWIGELEATSILVAVQGAVAPRPLAHDLMRSIVDATASRIERVEITRLEEGTYYAEITLETTAGLRVVDARPSDAVALASRVGCPLWVSDAVMEEAGVPDLTADEGSTEESIDEFKRFLNDVDPEDFRG
ncbi:bifunctional nuclease family protein [Microbacterium limosum]|uniref:Bifunctional nuclease family protein n=1 Tax=Microbacterium limosum TaxID=3079935 RepID=A0AAU0MHV6_9MICO|nr:bifunctional nuclease family protein [Microbacterium sp. Y20]WOQ70220.1 bifunctional nuclease family protein [Microbacterium sp. Y20]